MKTTNEIFNLSIAEYTFSDSDGGSKIYGAECSRNGYQKGYEICQIEMLKITKDFGEYMSTGRVDYNPLANNWTDRITSQTFVTIESILNHFVQTVYIK